MSDDEVAKMVKYSAKCAAVGRTRLQCKKCIIINSRDMKSVTGYWLPTRAFSSDIFGTFASRSSNLAANKMDNMNSTMSGTNYTSEKHINSNT